MTRGAGVREMSDVVFSMSEAMDILIGAATQTFKQDAYIANLRDRLDTHMKVAFDNYLMRDFYGLAMMDGVGDSFVGVLYVDPFEMEPMLCLELFLILHKFDILLPFNTMYETWLNRRYPNAVLEQHFGIPVIGPDVATVERFTDKSLFAAWLQEHDLSPFTPTIYTSIWEVSYPLLVKETNGLYGTGIHLVNTKAEMDAAIAAVEGDYILQEAVVGKTEPIIHFVARNGKLLATSCVLDRKQDSALFVTGRQHDLPPTDTVSCKDLDKISPLADIVRRIVLLTGYNGFGCFNFKFTARKMQQNDLDAYLRAIPALAPDSLERITTDFMPKGVRRQFASYAAVPKLFDWNTRMCGSHVRDQTMELYRMLRMYLEEVASESAPQGQ